MRRIVWVAPAVALALGCGSDEERAESNVKSFLSALAEGDGGKACDRMNGAAKRDLVSALNEALPEAGVATCPQAVSTAAENRGADERKQFEDVEVHVRLDGDRGTADIRGAGGAGAPGHVDLIKADGEWLIADAPD